MNPETATVLKFAKQDLSRGSDLPLFGHHAFDTGLECFKFEEHNEIRRYLYEKMKWDTENPDISETSCLEFLVITIRETEGCCFKEEDKEEVRAYLYEKMKWFIE